MGKIKAAKTLLKKAIEVFPFINTKPGTAAAAESAYDTDPSPVNVCTDVVVVKFFVTGFPKYPILTPMY